MCSMQLVWWAPLMSSWGISFCSTVQSFRGTRSAPSCFEPCKHWRVWVWVRSWRRILLRRAPDFCANRVSPHVYSGDCTSPLFVGFFLDVLNNLWLLFSGHIGDVPGQCGNCDVPTEMEPEVLVSRRRAVVTRRLSPLMASGVPWAQSWAASAGVWHWYGGFLMSIFLVLFLIDAVFLWLLLLDQPNADQASTSKTAMRHQLVTLCRAVCDVCWIS